MAGARMNIVRRDVLVGMAVALAAPRSIAAQPAGRPAHVGVYTTERGTRDAVVAGLHERDGWRVATSRSSGTPPRAPKPRLASTWQRRQTDVLVMGGPPRIRAAMRATTTIPIIGVDLESDPVTSGFVKTLAWPGGNVSGIWMDVPEISGKQIQFLREVLPALNRADEVIQ